MRVHRWSIILATSVLLGISGSSASAQIVRNYVASTGSDSNACSRTAPCRTFAGALAKTAAYGEIDVLDSAEYGTLTITNSISIVAENGLVAGISPPSAQFGILIDASSSDLITLKGLSINGGNPINGGTVGIAIGSAADVEIDDCEIHGFQTAGVELFAKTPSRVHLFRSVIYQNKGGVIVYPGGAVNGIVIDSSALDYNFSGGNIQVLGDSGALLLGNSSVQGGTSLTTSGNPTIQSYGDNRISNSFPAAIVQRQ